MSLRIWTCISITFCSVRLEIDGRNCEIALNWLDDDGHLNLIHHINEDQWLLLGPVAPITLSNLIEQGSHDLFEEADIGSTAAFSSLMWCFRRYHLH